MRKYIVTIVLVLVAFVSGYFIGDASAVKRANEQVALIKSQYEIESMISGGEIPVSETNQESESAGEWSEIITFEGQSIKDTETFAIASNEWRITWETEPGQYGDMNFQIYVYKEDGSLEGIAANVVGEASDVSYMRSSGKYYLTVNTGQPYKIVIEEK